ncbi:MAG: mitochondrial fission ELM1 family protein [Geminicoccaceae bacterium]
MDIVADHPPLPAAAPRTWLLLGPKPGDNGQVLALAEALGWPFESKRMVYRSTELLTNRLLGITLLGIDRRRSSPLEPPWPDLVISAGRRNEPVARWIRRKAEATKEVKLVHVGRPWAPLESFDLIVTTPQYALPEHPAVLHMEAPLHRVKPERLDEAACVWRPRLAALPMPRIAVMLGGHVGRWTFDDAAAVKLAEQANAMAEATGGSLLISTSARTPAKVVESFVRTLRVPHHLYRWRRDDPENPYLGFLALADRIIVTSDSMSMLVEAVATGKPVFIFDLAAPREGAPWHLPSGRALIWWLGRIFGPRQLVRNVTAIHRGQVAAGRAIWLGEQWPKGRHAPPLTDTLRAANAVRKLFAV